MSKTPAEFEELFAGINAKMVSKDPVDQKVLDTPEFQEIAEAVLYDFQSQSNHPGMEGLIATSKEYGFSHDAVLGMWRALGVAMAVDGSRNKEWWSVGDELVENIGGGSYFKVMLDAVTSAYGIAIKNHPGKSQVVQLNSLTATNKLGGFETYRLPTAGFVPSDYAGIPVFLDKADLVAQPGISQPKIDLDEILHEMKESPALKKALRELASDMTIDGARKIHRGRDDEGPGF